MSRYRSEESRQKARQSIMRTLSERSRKVREYDKLAQDRTVLLALVREGIECGGSTRQFLRWVERAKFIIANEPASSQETLADRQREPDAVEKQALYGNLRELYRRDRVVPETGVRCTCKDYPGADQFCTAHKVRPAHTAAHDCACSECVKAETPPVRETVGEFVQRVREQASVPRFTGTYGGDCTICGHTYDSHGDNLLECPTANR